MVYVLLFISLFISFFVLYTLSKNDFVLLRQNVSLTTIFDFTLLSLFLALVFGRLFYIIDSQSFGIFSLLPFFHVVRFSGFSVFGALLGGAISIFFFFRKKKILLRFYDILALSFYPLFLLHIFLNPYSARLILVKLVLFVGAVVIFFLLQKFHKNYTLRDGSIASTIAIVVSLENFYSQFALPRTVLFAFFSFSQVLSMVIIFAAALFLLVRERILKRT